MTPVSDAELIDRVLEGELESFRLLIERYQQPVYDLLRLMAPGRKDIEDLVQETFLDVYRYLPSFDRRRPFKPWLFKIARNRARKNRAKYALVSLSAGLSERLDEKGLVHASLQEDQGVSKMDETLIIHDAVRRLSRPLREVVALHYGEDLTLVEVAAVLDLPVGTVKSRLHKALRKLRSRLEPTLSENNASVSVRRGEERV